MLDRLRRAIIALTARADEIATRNLLRRALVLGAKLFSKPDQVENRLEHLAAAALFHETETGSWVPASNLLEGKGGPFDACDLRHWLALAERAGVPAVPAREILFLSDDELSALGGTIEVPDTAVVRKLRAGAADFQAKSDTSPAIEPAGPDVDLVELNERLHAAMDDIPEGWMVRSARSGSSARRSSSRRRPAAGRHGC